MRLRLAGTDGPATTSDLRNRGGSNASFTIIHHSTRATARGLRSIYFLGFLTALAGSFLLAAVSNAQTPEPKIKPDIRRALGARPDRFTPSRADGRLCAVPCPTDGNATSSPGAQIYFTLSIDTPGSRIFINKLRCLESNHSGHAAQSRAAHITTEPVLCCWNRRNSSLIATMT